MTVFSKFKIVTFCIHNTNYIWGAYNYIIHSYKYHYGLGGSVVKNPPAVLRHGFDPWVGKIPRRRK